MKSNVTTINEIDIYYEQCLDPAKKTVLVMLHGFLSSSFCFRKLTPILERNFSIVSIDIPPFGKSGKSKQFRYSFENIANTILTLLRYLEIQKVVFVAHSMGGQVALYAAKQAPQLMDKLILLNSSAYLPKVKRKLITATYLPFSAYLVRRILKKQGVLANLQLCTFDHSIIDDDMIEGYSTPFYDNMIYHALIRLARHREGDLSSQELQKIQTPTLLLWGKHDKVVPLEKGMRLQQDLPNAIMKIYEDAGHLLPEEKPEAVAADIIQFLT